MIFSKPNCGLFARVISPGILLLSLIVGLAPDARAADPAVEVTSALSITSSNAVSRLDRRTREIVSEVDLSLENTSQQTLSGPLWLVVETTSDQVAQPLATGSWVGPDGTWTPQRSFYDLSGLFSASGLTAGQSITIHLKFVRYYRVRFTYSSTVYGPAAGPTNLAPIADAGADQTLGLLPGQNTLGVLLDGSASRDDDGSISSYLWAGVPTPAGVVQPTVTLGEGSHVFTLIVTDNLAAPSAEDSVTIIVEAADPHAPVVNVSPTQFSVVEGGTLDIPVSATDSDGEPVALSAAPGIVNTAFTSTPGSPATGMLTFNPDYDQQGLYVVAFTGRDPLGYTSTQSVQIAVENVNRSPSLGAPTSVEVDEGGRLTIPITATDPDDDPLTLSATGLPANALFIPSTGIISFTPGFDQAGGYTVTVALTDGAETVTQAIDITVNDVPTGTGAPAELILEVDPVETPTLRSSANITGRVNSQAVSQPQTIQTSLITGLSPANGRQGETLEVAVTGQTGGDFETHFLDGSSQAVFGTGVQINSLTVTSPTEALANITIAADAEPGTRAVNVITGAETALSMLAFQIELGRVPLTGILLDPDTGLPIVGAIITLEGTTLSTISGADGSFAFVDVPVGSYVLIINSPDHELVRVEVNAQVGEDLVLGNLEPEPTVFDPSAPPAATVFSVIGRGVADPQGSLAVDAAKLLIIDTIIAVGGTEAGVLDAYGNQLNPNVSGDGLVSLRNSGLDDMAKQLLAGDTITVGELLARFLRVFDYQGEPVPTLINTLAAIQQVLDRGDSELFQVLFGDSRQAGSNPARIGLDTSLNAVQSYLMTSSLLGFVHVQRTAPDAVVQNSQPPVPIMLASAANVLGSLVVSDAGGPPLVPAATGAGKFTIPWEDVFEVAEPLFIGNIKSKGVQLCEALTNVQPPATCGNGSVEAPEECDGTPGCTASCTLAIKPIAPGCTEMADLVELLISDQGDAVTGASETFTEFFLSEGATALTADRLKQEYQSAPFQAAWEESRKEARDLGKLTEFVNKTAEFVEGQLSNIAGQMVSTMLQMQTELIIASLRPDPPLITKVEQLPDPTTGELSNTVRITFQRSLRDRGDSNADNHTWFYELWREQGGQMGRVTSGRVRLPSEGPGPRPTDNPDTLIFYDLNTPEGTVIYRIRSVRMIGTIVADQPPSALDTVFQMASGLVPLDFATPGGVTVMGGDTLKMLLDPVAQILKGIKIQKSPFSDAGPFFVSLKPRPPAPPANLATDHHAGRTYVSIPFLGRIFKAEDGEFTEFADSNFKAPHQIGLGIDDAGTLYTDNAASDSLYSGRLFSFDRDTAGRSFVGTVNYYSLMLQYGHPAAVQALAVGPGPFGEALYIADSLDNRITQLRLPSTLPAGIDLSHNVSQSYLNSSELLFGPESAMVFRGDGTLFVTLGNDILNVPYGGGRFDRLFDDSFAPSPFGRLSGIAIDQRSNLYVSDIDQHNVYQIPFDAQFAGAALKGYDAVNLKKLVIARNFVRPTQVQLAPNRRGLVLFDANGVHSLNFGMSGQVTDPAGTPLLAAKVIATDTVPNHGSVTDGDGIYVLPDLVGDTRNVVDVTIRHGGRTQTQRVILDPFGHNVRDFVFDPPDLPTGTDPIDITPAPDPAPPPIEVDLVAGDTVVVMPETSLSMVAPVTPPVADAEPPRTYLLSPGTDMVVTGDTVRVQGLVSDPLITEGTLLVNGERQPVTLSNGELDRTVTLRDGDNEISLEIKEGGVKGELAGAATQAAADTLTEMDDVQAGFGTGIANTWGLAGQSIRAEFSELPEGYRAGTTLQNLASSVQDKADASAARLANLALPSSAEMTALSADLAAIEARSDISELQRVATAGLRSSHDATTLRAEQARVEMGLALSRVQTDKDRLEAYRLDIEATFPASQAKNDVTAALGASASALGNMIVFYDQQQLPETLVAHEVSHRVQNLTSTIDTNAGSFTPAQQATLTEVRILAQSTDTQTRGDHGLLSVKVGDVLADVGALAGRTVESLVNQIADSSVTPEIRQAATELHNAAEPALATFRTGRLPSSSVLAPIDARIAGLAQQATADLSPLTQGLTQALQRRSTRAQVDLQAGKAAFSQSHGDLDSAFSGLDAKVAAVEGLPDEAVPEAFAAISTGLQDSAQEILDSLWTNQLPLAGLVGDPSSGRPGALDLRAGNLDQMFTVLSPFTKIRKVDEDSAQALRDSRGFDTVLSGVLRERTSGRPVAGEEIGVPGQAAMTAATNRDGVFQVQMDTQRLNELISGFATVMQGRYGTMLSMITNIRSAGGSGAEVNEGLSSLILEAARVQDDPPAALSTGTDLVSLARRVEELATSRLADVEAGRTLSDAQIDEMQAEVQKMQALIASAQAVMKAMHDTNMTIIRNIR